MKLKEICHPAQEIQAGVYLNRQEEQDHPDEGTDIHDTGPADNEAPPAIMRLIPDMTLTW